MTTAPPLKAALPALAAALLLAACGGDVSWCGSSGRDGGHLAIGYNADPPRCPQPRQAEAAKAAEQADLDSLAARVQRSLDHPPTTTP